MSQTLVDIGLKDGNLIPQRTDHLYQCLQKYQRYHVSITKVTPCMIITDTLIAKVAKSKQHMDEARTSSFWSESC